MEKFQVNSTKELSVNTARVYKSKLNKLVPYGYKDSDDLKNHPVKIIAIITDLTKNIVPEDKQRMERRVFYSAIFYALHGDSYLSRPTLYQREFHKSDPKKNANGEDWKSVADFKATLDE
jgi:hypothetical protein